MPQLHSRIPARKVDQAYAIGLGFENVIRELSFRQGKSAPGTRPFVNLSTPGLRSHGKILIRQMEDLARLDK